MDTRIAAKAEAVIKNFKEKDLCHYYLTGKYCFFERVSLKNITAKKGPKIDPSWLSLIHI